MGKERKAKLREAVDELVALVGWTPDKKSSFMDQLVSNIRDFYRTYRLKWWSNIENGLVTAMRNALREYLALVSLLDGFNAVCHAKEMGLEECILVDMWDTIKEMKTKGFFNGEKAGTSRSREYQYKTTNRGEHITWKNGIGEILRLFAVTAIRKSCKKISSIFVYNTIMEDEVNFRKLQVILSRCGTQISSRAKDHNGAKDHHMAALGYTIGFYVLQAYVDGELDNVNFFGAVNDFCRQRNYDIEVNKAGELDKYREGLGKCILEQPRSDFNELKPEVDVSSDVDYHAT
eukprot:GHVU01223725.1.p1 GENE.GHVU01223725.1~~GHVU01223725.1.p1  ORF type:complete len:306 (-),score=32.27 GHVU01223725.1:762-1631(-)